MTTFSIIIPCYNTGPKIANALQSIVNQEFPPKNIEVLIIDDHSIDQSHIDLAKTYMDRLNIKFYNNEGKQGTANGRRIGLDNAQGEWILFLDSDDKLAPIALNFVQNVLDQVQTTPNVIVGQFIQTDLDDKPLHDPLMTPTMCHGKFYRREFLNEYNIRPKKDLYSHDDLQFNCQILALYDQGILPKNTYLAVNQVFYYWHQEPESFTTKLRFEEHYEDLIEALGLPFKAGAAAGNEKCIIRVLDLLYQLYFFTQYFLYYHQEDVIEKNKILQYNKSYKQMIYDELKIDKDFVVKTLTEGDVAANKYASLFSYCCGFVKKEFQPIQSFKDFIVNG